MFYRIFLFVLLLGASGLLGVWLGDTGGALAGVLLAGTGLFALDLWRGQRFMRWIGAPGDAPPPDSAGLWGEAASRTRRALRLEQEQARGSELRLQAFLAAVQASPNGVVLLDPHGRIEWCNEMAAQQFGFDAQRDRMQHVGHLVRQPGFSAYYAAQDYERDVVLVGRADTPSHPVKLSVQLFPYGDGRKLLLSRDMTALAQAEAMRRDFVANVSHEIRTPLTVLSGFIETMQTLPLDAAERDGYLELMAGQAARMQMLVSDLLALSRLEGSPLPSSSEAVDLKGMMIQCEAEARGLSGLLHPDLENAQDLRFEPMPGIDLVGAAAEIRSAISNLIVNAVRYTPACGRIDVRWVRLPDGGAEFSVTDTGPGIAAQHLPRLSERFYRVDRSRSRESGGTGLGLAITKHVVQRHGGELKISSKMGEGSRFAFILPAARVRGQAAAGEVMPALSAAPPTPAA